LNDRRVPEKQKGREEGNIEVLVGWVHEQRRKNLPIGKRVKKKKKEMGEGRTEGEGT